MTATVSAPRNTLFTVRSKAGQAVAYVYRTAKGQLAAIAYMGKSAKAVWHYGFRSLAEVARKVSELVSAAGRIAAAKAERRAATKAQTRTLKVGDVLVRSWGYSMTIVEFYQVVGLVGTKSVMLQRVGAKQVGEADRGGGTRVVADVDHKSGVAFKALTRGDRACLPGKDDTASKWDGRSMYDNRND